MPILKKTAAKEKAKRVIEARVIIIVLRYLIYDKRGQSIAKDL